MQMADKVDQLNYFDDCADQDDQELRQTTMSESNCRISHSELLKNGMDSTEGSDADYSKSSKNSPSEIQSQDTSAKTSSQDLSQNAPKPIAMALSNPSKLLEMVNIQADDSSSCKQELGNLTEEEALLFLKLVKLCKDPKVANQFVASADSNSKEPTT